MKQKKAIFLALVGTCFLLLSYVFVSNQNLGNSIRKRKINKFISDIVGYGRDLVPRARGEVCSTLPVVKKIHNTHWQHCQKSSVYLYSAFFDTRYRRRGITFPKVRVLGMSEGKLKGDLFCLLWERNISYSVSARSVEIWIKNWDDASDDMYYRPYIFTCPLPKKLNNVNAVSIISSSCEQPTVYFPLINSTQSRKKDFAICVKGMDFKNDISLRIIEWIELHLLLGADVISIYVYSVHPNVEKVLNYYQSKGVLEMRYLSKPGEDKNASQFLHEDIWQKRRIELIPYNDCFYNHMYTHRFVVLLDLDETVLPIQHYTWQELMVSILEMTPNSLETYCSLSAQNVYFFDDFGSDDNNSTIPSYMHMLKHVHRSVNFSKLGYAVKSFCSTNNTLAVFNHYALLPLYPKLRRNGIMSKEFAHLHHYREKCPPKMEIECEKDFLRYRKKDTLIWKYSTDLVDRVQTAIRELNLNLFTKI